MQVTFDGCFVLGSVAIFVLPSAIVVLNCDWLLLGCYFCHSLFVLCQRHKPSCNRQSGSKLLLRHPTDKNANDEVSVIIVCFLYKLSVSMYQCISVSTVIVSVYQCINVSVYHCINVMVAAAGDAVAVVVSFHFV